MPKCINCATCNGFHHGLVVLAVNLLVIDMIAMLSYSIILGNVTSIPK